MKYYISRGYIIFSYVIILIVLGLGVTLMIFENSISGGILVLAGIIAFVKNFNQPWNEDPVVILEKEYLEVVMGNER